MVGLSEDALTVPRGWVTYTDCGGERLLRQDNQTDKADDTEADGGTDQVDREGLTVARRAQSAIAVEVSGQAVGALVAGAGRNHRRFLVGVRCRYLMLARLRWSSRKSLARSCACS